MRDDRLRIERLDPEAKVIHVPAFFPGRRAAGLAQGAVDLDEIDHRVAYAKMGHAELRPVGHVVRA
jgi:hypothetical protein